MIKRTANIAVTIAGILLIAGVFLSGCSGNKSVLPYNHIAVDPKEQSVMAFSDLFSKIELVVPETGDSSMIRRVEKVIHWQDRFYVFDRSQDAVFIFDETGGFSGKIQREGKGPGEYLDIRDMEINRHTNCLELLAPRGRIFSFSPDGEFRDVFSLPPEIRAVHFFANIDEDIMVFYSMFEKEKLIFYSRSQKKVLRRARSVPTFVARKAPLGFVNSPFFFFRDTVYYYETFSNNVHRLSDTLALAYRWDFGDFNFNIEELPADRPREYYKKKFSGSTDFAWGFSFGAINTNYVFTAFTFGGEHLTLLYDRQAKSYQLVGSFKKDLRLPVVNLRMSTDGSYFYSVVEPAQKDIFVDPGLLDPVGRERLNRMQINDNPLIALYYFKR